MAGLSLYRNFVRTAFGKVSFWKQSDPLDIDVSIEGGVHAGSVIRLSSREFVIGPSETGDVMLFDADAAGEQITVAAERSFLGPMISVSSERSDVTIDDKPVDIAKEAQTFRLPCTLTLGGIPIRLIPNAESLAASRPSSDNLRIAGLCCICIVALGFGTNWGQPAKSDYDITNLAQDQDEATEPVALARTTIASRVFTSLAGVTLRDNELSSYLSAVQKSPKAIAIIGNLPEGMLRNWHAAREQLHAIDSNMLILSDFEISAATPTLPAIAAVRFGTDPSLIFADRTEGRIGETIADGWQLDAITDTGLRLTRSGVTVKVDY